jgi:hypothetical protein
MARMKKRTLAEQTDHELAALQNHLSVARQYLNVAQHEASANPGAAREHVLAHNVTEFLRAARRAQSALLRWRKADNAEQRDLRHIARGPRHTIGSGVSFAPARDIVDPWQTTDGADVLRDLHTQLRDEGK